MSDNKETFFNNMNAFHDTFGPGPSYHDSAIFGPAAPSIDNDKLLIHKLEEEICALNHNYSILENERNLLRSQLRLCVEEASDRLMENKELLKEVELLKIEVEKIHSRYEILDIR